MNTLYTDKIFVLYQNDNEFNRFNNYVKNNKININYELIKSINFNSNDDYIFLQKRKVNFKDYNFNKYLDFFKNYKLNENQISHSKSIINILKKSIENNYNSIVILEYDIILNKNIFNLLPNYKKIIHNSDIVYLGSSQHNWYNKIFNSKLEYYLNNKSPHYKASHSLGTFGIILKKNVFEIYIKYLELFLFSSDIILAIISYNFKSIVIYPNLIICDLSSSTILEDRNMIRMSLKFKWNLNNYLLD